MTRPHEVRRSVGLLALVATGVSLSWLLIVARPAASYLFVNNIYAALRETWSLVLGHTAARQLYSSGSYVAPRWETIAGFLAVGLVLIALPPAIYRAWRLRDRVSIAIAVGVAVLFPLSLLPRLAPNGVALSARSWEYIFIGLGCVLGLLARDSVWPTHSRGNRLTGALNGWRRTGIATLLVAMIFVGDVTIGTAFFQLLPEASHPSGYPWSVQPDVVTASIWARDHLGMNQRFGSNAIDSLALATYGEQDTLKERLVWPIFFSGTIDQGVVDQIRSTGVQYLLVDWRMTRGLPATSGYYFSTQEPDAGRFTEVFPAIGLEKFSSASCVSSVYHSGPIQIVDVSRITDGSCVPVSASGTGSVSDQ
jgi:hypothetical protein